MNLELVIKAVYSEAEHESDIGMEGIVWIIKNRMKDKRWTSNVEQVVKSFPHYSKSETMSNKTPIYRHINALVNRVWSEVADPINGAVFFSTKKFPQWWSKSVAEGGQIQRGNLYFSGKVNGGTVDYSKTVVKSNVVKNANNRNDNIIKLLKSRKQKLEASNTTIIANTTIDNTP